MDVQHDLPFDTGDLDHLQTFNLDDGSEDKSIQCSEPPSHLLMYPQSDDSDWVLSLDMLPADMDAFGNQPIHTLDFNEILDFNETDWTTGPSNLLSSDTSCLDNECKTPSTTATTFSQPTPGVSPILSTISDPSSKSRRSSVHTRPKSPEPTTKSSKRRKSTKTSDGSLDDPGHKRVQERNRIAASKFRSRKRESAAQLRTDEEDIELLNQDLNTNYEALVLEVQQLKMQLLQHSDCDCHLIQSYIKHEANRLVHSLDKDPKSKVTEPKYTSPRAPAV